MCLVAVSLLSMAGAEAKPARPETTTTEEATRLQVFLDKANFGPGKIDGHYGTFTRQALELYRQSRGEQPAKTTDDKTPPDTTGLDLASVDPLFNTYVITEADAKTVGELRGSLRQQAEGKSMPYTSLAEAIAEKFHCDQDYLAELNPGIADKLKVGDSVKVPNVTPFDVTAVKHLEPGSATDTDGINEAEDADVPSKSESGNKSKGKNPDNLMTNWAVHVSTKLNMLELREGDQLKAAFPVTVGSDRTESPLGQWKVQRIAKLPNFRYDEKMLKEGERSSDFFVLPPGPNNLVGILWIALNKKGIGIHGTNSPDTIGRSASHGCIRLANWDVVKLAEMIKPGVKVTID